MRIHSLFCLIALVGALSLPAATCRAAGSETKEKPKNAAETLYNEGVALAEEGRHAAALVKFRAAHEQNPGDADVMNMLAHSLRKTGKLDEAFAMYEKALAARENFAKAREYLGEAHLQAALIQVQILRGYGKEGEKELAALLDALRRAANEAAGTDFEVTPSAW